MSARVAALPRRAAIAAALALSAFAAAARVPVECDAVDASVNASVHQKRATGPGLTISVVPATSQVPSLLDHAYRAYQAGEFDAAKAAYLNLLAIEPLSRDALLGAAAIALREGDPGRAETLYLKLIAIDPRDVMAQAALAGLQGPAGAAATESRIRTGLAARPEGAHLYFALGNQHAAQARWQEALAAYLRAYAAEPDHPDFAYNLAVGYDRLRRSALALEYYRRALKLASDRRPSFDVDAVGARVLRLAPPPVPGRAP